MICKKCGADIPDQARFCNKCGNVIEKKTEDPVSEPENINNEVKCRSCGASIPPQARFCNKCGNAVLIKGNACGTAVHDDPEFRTECGAPGYTDETGTIDINTEKTVNTIPETPKQNDNSVNVKNTVTKPAANTGSVTSGIRDNTSSAVIIVMLVFAFVIALTPFIKFYFINQKVSLDDFSLFGMVDNLAYIFNKPVIRNRYFRDNSFMHYQLTDFLKNSISPEVKAIFIITVSEVLLYIYGLITLVLSYIRIGVRKLEADMFFWRLLSIAVFTFWLVNLISFLTVVSSGVLTGYVFYGADDFKFNAGVHLIHYPVQLIAAVMNITAVVKRKKIKKAIKNAALNQQ